MAQATLLERGPLLEGLAAQARLAFAGAGRLVLLGGEAGVGKTSLLRAFVASQAGRATVLLGACDAMTVPRPLAPLLDFAAAVSSDFAALAAAGDERRRLFSMLLEKLGDSRRPHLLVFEDLHWADEATLDLLRYLGRRLEACPALLIGSYRDDEVGPSHPLRRVMGDLAGASTVLRLQVPTLSLTAVGELVGQRRIDATELHRRTGGNPFFVTEVLAADGDALPAKVGDAVMARVSRLADDARQALDLASVIGLSTDAALLERLAPSAEAVEACLAAGLLSSQATTLTFRHEMAREAVLASMSASRRRRTHAAVLAALVAALPAMRADGQVDAHGAVLAVLAHHAAEAGDGFAVLRYAPAAARLAVKLRAFNEARFQFGRALSYAAEVGLDPEDQAALLDEYGSACFTSARDDDATGAFQTAAQNWRSVDRPDRQASSLAWLASTRLAMGHKQESEQIFRQAMQLVEDLPETAEHATVYTRYAHARMLDRDTEPALHWARKAISSGRRTGNLQAVCGVHNAAAGALVTAERISEARRHHRACIHLIEQGHVPDAEFSISSARIMMGTGLGEVHRFQEAEPLLASAEEFACRHDIDAQGHYAVAWRALTHVYLGRWQEAGAAATSLLALPHLDFFSRIMVGVALGRLRTRRGDPEVWPVLDQALEDALATDTLQRLAPVRAARAEAALAKGDDRLAREEAAAVLPLALHHRHRWFVGELLYLAWMAGGEPEVPDWLTGPFAMQLRGKPKEAARAWQRMGCTFEQARALTETEEVPSLRGAFDLFQGLGARPMATKVADRLRQLGVRGLPRGPSRATAADPAGLTPREREVLRLMAEGLRNAEIAERHGVSRRTVEHQVSAVLAKLGTSSRTAALAEAQRQGWIGSKPGPE